MSDILSSLGVGSGNTPNNIFSSTDQFQQANMSPSDIFSLGGSIPQTIGGIPGIGSRIPSLAKIPIPGVQSLVNKLAPINNAKFSVDGTYESVHYADDLQIHHPKFKFLFKVKFEGFQANDFEYFVYKCEKPKVRFNHTDINYYNFRTRVLTSVIYEPLHMTFLDEVGNSVFNFFSSYIQMMSGTGQGNYGIDTGWGSSSSSIPYANGYSNKRGQKIILEQIFVNLAAGTSGGPMSNRYTFLNPRIETFDFDELSHDEGSTGSNASISFSYDSILTETQTDSTIYSWGKTDLFKAGGSSGMSNSGSVDGNPMYTNGGPSIKNQIGIYGALQKGADVLSHIPNALSGLLSPILAGPAAIISKLDHLGGSLLSGGIDVLSSNISTTLSSITSGMNTINKGASVSQSQIISQDLPQSITSSEGVFNA